MSSKKDKGYVKLYHHTSNDGVRGILAEGKIKESVDTQKDAAFGKGAYATQHGPEKSKSQIAKNNYDGMSTHYLNQEKQGKVDHCIEFKVPASSVSKAKGTDRDVWVHKGDIDLKQAKDVKVHVGQQSGSYKTYEYNKDK